MNHQHLSFKCTSAELEKFLINRYRSLVSWLPSDCCVFREPWDCSTVLCFDFVKCPSLLPVVRLESKSLVDVAQKLGLANTIIFRIGNKFIG